MVSFRRQFIACVIILAIQIFLTIVILSNSTVAQNNSNPNNSNPKKSEPSKPEPKKPEPPKTEPKVQRIAGLNAKFIFAIISDGGNGAWIGTEDEGVFHYNANGKITQYTTKNGLGDNNAYALAIDKLGRLWVGHLNKGISVFNGKDWKNYDVVDGPIGERIFDIKICPKDDDVWLATSAGLSRYRIDANKWEHLTREDGLLEDQASALAFKSDGTLIVGTQCHGLAIFNRNEKGEYKHAQNIVAPERFGPNNCSPVPLTPRGQGLPSNQINDIIVTKNTASKSIFIATSAGLVRASNDFSKLEYTRGRDYADKVRGLYGGAPKDFKQPATAILDQLVPNDHLTTVVEDLVGQIWVGTWANGILVFDTILAKRGTATQKSSGVPDNFVTKILPLKDSNFLVGTYGGGIAKSTQPFNMSGRKPATEIFAANEYSVRTKDFRHLPFPIKPPTINELKSIQTKLSKLKTPLPKVYAAYYGEDWKTQGNWVGQYGRQYAVMCAANAPFDHNFYYNEDFFTVRGFIGPFHNNGDTIRRWVHWIETDNPRTLYSPLDAYRRQSEWDDHGEAYPLSKDGPDVWYFLKVKNPGIYRVDMYFFNKDGHSRNNRLRDYSIEFYKSPTGLSWGKGLEWQIFSELAEQQVIKSPPIAKSRIRDFWGGVHKQFIVKGSEDYFVKVRRNYSFNTIVGFVGIDRILGEPTLHDKLGISPWMEKVRCEQPEIPETYKDENVTLAKDLWKKIDEVADKSGYSAIQRKIKLNIFQVANATKQQGENESQFHKAIAWRLNQWYNDQRKEWESNMAEAWRQFGIRDPDWVKARDEFLIKRDSYPSTEKSNKEGVRLKVPTFVPVPPSLKRKPN
jgi:hypothetical protein